MKLVTAWAGLVMVAFMAAGAGEATAHCDTLGGPVVADARKALETGNVTVALKWVKKENEPEVRQAFNKAMTVRKQGPEAMELADMYFIENFVRIHRAGEGAPYRGLKPAGAVDPAIAEADKALATGSADKLAKMVADAAAQGVRERFNRTMEAKRHSGESVEAGRRYVAEYVDFTHYVERLHQEATTKVGHQSVDPHQHGHK